MLNRLKRGIAIAVLGFSLFSSADASALSKRTVQLEKEAQKTYLVYKNKKTWTESEKNDISGAMIKLCESLSKDIFANLKAGKYSDSFKQFETYEKFVSSVRAMGKITDKLATEHRNMTATIKSVKRYLKKEKLRNGPTRKFVVKGKNFKLIATIKYSFKEPSVLDYTLHGIPSDKKEWTAATKGLPRDAVKFMEYGVGLRNKVFKKQIGK